MGVHRYGTRPSRPNRPGRMLVPRGALPSRMLIECNAVLRKANADRRGGVSKRWRQKPPLSLASLDFRRDAVPRRRTVPKAGMLVARKRRKARAAQGDGSVVFPPTCAARNASPAAGIWTSPQSEPVTVLPTRTESAQASGFTAVHFGACFKTSRPHPLPLSRMRERGVMKHPLAWR
jgi:hypothetical protein